MPVHATLTGGTIPTSQLGTGTANSTTFLRGDNTWATPSGGGGVSDGDKGDITVSGSGTVWTVDAGAISTTKLGGDITTAGKALLDDADAAAQRTTLGLGTAATTASTDYATAVHSHSVFTSVANGYAPASGGGTTNFLRADGTWTAPPAPAIAETVPSTPATGASLFALVRADWRVLAYKDTRGVVFPLQQHLGMGSHWVLASANGAQAVTPGLIGLAAATTTGTTFTSNTPTGGVNYATRVPAVNGASASAAGSIAPWYFSTSTGFFVSNGSGLGGFLACFRFRPADPATVSGARMFVGLANATTAPANTEPSALTNVIGVAQLSTSTNMHIVYGGSTAQAAIDLGASFPMATTNGTPLMYDVTFYAPNNSSTTVYYEVENLQSGVTTTGTLTAATSGTQLPATTTTLTPRLWRTNNATALAVAWRFSRMYIEDMSSF